MKKVITILLNVIIIFSVTGQNQKLIGAIDTTQTLDTTIVYGSSYTTPILYEPPVIDA